MDVAVDPATAVDAAVDTAGDAAVDAATAEDAAVGSADYASATYAEGVPPATADGLGPNFNFTSLCRFTKYLKVPAPLVPPLPVAGSSGMYGVPPK